MTPLGGDHPTGSPPTPVTAPGARMGSGPLLGDGGPRGVEAISPVPLGATSQSPAVRPLARPGEISVFWLAGPWPHPKRGSHTDTGPPGKQRLPDAGRQRHQEITPHNTVVQPQRSRCRPPGASDTQLHPEPRAETGVLPVPARGGGALEAPNLPTQDPQSLSSQCLPWTATGWTCLC